MYFRMIRWLHRFEEHPNYNKWGAGLYQLLWTHWCGYGWKFAWRSASIYWFNRWYRAMRAKEASNRGQERATR